MFFLLLVAVRGLPAMFLYRRDLPRTQRVQMMLLTATALPLLVALSEIGLSTGHMLPENAAALVGAGVLSVIVLPGLAVSPEQAGRPLGCLGGTHPSATSRASRSAGSATSSTGGQRPTNAASVGRALNMRRAA